MGTRHGLVIAAAVMGGFGLANSLQAGTFAFDPFGTGGANAVTMTTFDWAPGNALAKNGNQAVLDFYKTGTFTPVPGFGTIITNGQQDVITGHYQASLSVLKNGTTDVTPAAFAGSGKTQELTVVSTFRETVSAITLSPGLKTVNFSDSINSSLSSTNFLEIWHGPANANDLAGTGFNDGKLVLRAHLGPANTSNSNFRTTGGGLGTALDQLGPNNYPGIDTVLGNGDTDSGQGGLLVDYYDPAYFVDGVPVTSHINATQTLPFDVVDPSAMFVENLGGVAPTPDGAGVPGDLGTINGALNLNFIFPPASNLGSGGPDIQFPADGNQTFDVTPSVPEPLTATMGLLSLGAIGLVVSRRRNA